MRRNSLRYNTQHDVKRKLLILAAMQMECRAVAEALGARMSSREASANIEIAGMDLKIWTVGIGCAWMDAKIFGCGEAAPHPGLWPEHRGEGDAPAAVIVAGLAGALDPTLQIGDVVIDAPEPSIPADFPARSGRIHSTNQIVCAPKEKAELFARTGALAVDMELQIVRDAVRDKCIPVIGLRAISDRADEVVDPAVLRFVDDLGRPRIGAILWRFLRRPRLIRQAWRLARNSSIACRRLGEAVRELVTHPEFIRRFGSSADCREGCERRA